VRRRTKVIAAIALGAAATSGWWVLRAPAIERHAVAPPDPDIDPPATRARRDAAIALAKTPDDQRRLARSPASSASAGTPAPDVDMALCGAAEKPRFSEDRQLPDGSFVQDQTRSAGPDYLAARANIDAKLRASNDPFDRATADWLNVGEMRTQEGRLDALVQHATASRDPRVYGLAYRACLRSQPAAPSCATLDPRAWAALDPGNGVPWAYVLARANAARDQPAAREALAAMAAADRFNDNRSAISGVVASYPARSDTELGAIDDFIEWDTHNDTSFDFRPMDALKQACGHRADSDADTGRECQAIDDVMFDHSDSLSLRASAGDLQIAMTGDKRRRNQFSDEVRRAARVWSADMTRPPCTQVRIYLARVRHRVAVGEVQEMLEAPPLPTP
jgi:hypothetical protein